jgi:adenylosuccinate synthase
MGILRDDPSSLGNCCVVGLQWGDEGKGKIIDVLCPRFDYVVRYCGGANAGHTVVAEGNKFALHLLPTGVLCDTVISVIGNGVVVDPGVLLKELDDLAGRGRAVPPSRLRLSLYAHVVMPWHKQQDRLAERAAAGEGKSIGTTVRGIGPCYADKANRTWAIRICDLLDPARLSSLVRRAAEAKSKIFAALYGERTPLDADAIIAEHTGFARRLAEYADDTVCLLNTAIRNGKRILFEGAQGSLLDVDLGTYPYVTSSNSTSCGIPAGAGVPARTVRHTVGIIKAYTTRVGAGPFPSEQDNQTGETIRQRGHEFGTTTGRPRRCGWFDAVAVRHSAAVNGVDELSVMLLDVLSGIKEISICTGYRLNGRDLDWFPADAPTLANVQCVYETLPGWSEDIAGCERIEQLPAAARRYLDRLAELIGVPIGIVSVGPDRRQTLAR